MILAIRLLIYVQAAVEREHILIQAAVQREHRLRLQIYVHPTVEREHPPTPTYAFIHVIRQRNSGHM